MGTPMVLERLTTTSTSEKPNDPGYRVLPVYRAHPNEPSCACPPPPPPIASDKAKTNKRQQQQQLLQLLELRSRCCSSSSSSCGNRLRDAAVQANDPGKALPRQRGGGGGGAVVVGKGRRGRLFMPTHCAATTTTTTTTTTTAKNDEQQQQLDKRRMRGGGGGEGSDILAANLFSADADFTWYNSRFAMPPARLEGGGGAQYQTYPAVGCGKALAGKPRTSGFQGNFDDTFLRTDSMNPEYLSLNRCRLRHVEDKSDARPECSCTGKDHMDTLLKKKGQAVCRKKPCMGTDCLIQAFKDAQDFVESIGKVPGLAGLGITESPYFGRPQEPRENRKADSKATPAAKQTDATPTATSNLFGAQNVENQRRSNYNGMSMALNAPKKLGVVQEGITSYPDPSTHASLKSKRRDEKAEKPKEVETLPPQLAEDTPCGEPKCKSRPKKKVVAEDEEEGGPVESAEPKEQTKQKPPSAQKFDKKHSSKGRSHSVPSDKTSKTKKSPRYDHSYGNAYPTSVYGHKKCNLRRPRIPAHMGWLWNQFDAIANRKPREGWRPGAISVTLKELLKEAREGFFKQAKRPMSLPRLGAKKTGKAQKTTSYTSGMKKGTNCEEAETEEEVEFPPTLHVHRKDGTYYVTMYPIRQDPTGAGRLDEPINPLQFKIVKSKDSLATSSTASDMEIEFSPPAAVNRLRRKPNVVHVETQVKQQEILDAFRKPSDANKKPKGGKEKGQKDKKKK